MTLMTIQDIEKKLNQIQNMFNLIHRENIFFLSLMANMTNSVDDRKIIENYINECMNEKTAIMSGMYEDDINIVG